MAVFTSYREILSVPGALRFSLLGLVARLPISMVGLGIVLLVSAADGKYAVAGTVAAAFTLTTAVFAIPQGRLVDRLGQRRVLAAASSAFGLALALCTWSVQSDWPLVTTYVAAAAAGASLPQIGSCVRARWSYVLAHPRRVQTAYALESVVDETVFMVGPIVVTGLATAWDPVAGLAVAIMACLVGGWAFALQGATEPPAHPRDRSSTARPAMPWRTILPLAVVAAGLGMLFGAVEVTTVAFSGVHGHRGAAGPLLALWAFGSLVAGMISGTITWRRGPSIRVRWGAAGMAVAMVPLHFIDSIPVMGAFLLLAGFAIAPTLVATMSLTEQTTPASRLTEGMTVMQTGLVAGVAPGASIAGLIIDAHGASAAYLVGLAAGSVAALAAQTLPRTRD